MSEDDVSQEPHPKSDRTTPGSTPAPGDLPAEERADRGDHEVPPTESVPDEVAERAARAEDPRASGPGRAEGPGRADGPSPQGPTRGQDVPEDDVMHPHPASSDVHGMPSGDV